MSPSILAAPGTHLSLMTALLFSYIWLWKGSFPGHFYVCVALAVAIGFLSHRTRNETAAEIGFRLDNLGSCVFFGMRFIVPISVVAVALGMWIGTAEPPLWKDAPRSLTKGWMWGTMQQYGLACFYYRRLRDVVASHGGATVGAAGLFALAHLPNPFLMPVTFATGIVACHIYRRAPNVFGLGLLHVLLSIALRQAFGSDVTHHMKVGPQ